MKWLVFAFRNVLRNRRRSLAALSITAVGTAAVISSGGFALFTYQSLRELAARDTGHIVLAARAFFDGDEDLPLQNGLEDVAALRERLQLLPGVRAVLPRIQFSGLISNGDKSAVFIGSGIVPEADFRVRGPQMKFVTGTPAESGGAVPEVVLGTELARLMKARVGSSLTLLATTTEGSLNAIDVVVRGTASVGIPDVDRRMVLTDIQAVQKLLLSTLVSTLAVYLRETGDTAATAARIAADESHLAVRTWLDLAVFYQAVQQLYNRIFGVLGAIMVVIVMFALSYAMNMAVAERTREIGTLRAIGTHPREIVRNFLFEGATIGIGGAAAGAMLAGLATLLLTFANVQMPPPPGRSDGYPLLISPSATLYIATAAAVIAIAVAAAFFASAKAARKPITVALSHV